MENIVIYADAQRAPTLAILSILISQTSTRASEFGRFKEPIDSSLFFFGETEFTDSKMIVNLEKIRKRFL